MASRIYDFRKALADSIVAAGVLSADQVVVERQTDIFADIDAAVGQEGGICLTIAAMSGKHIDPDADDLIFEVELLLTLWSVVEFDATTRPEESVHEALMRHVHHLELSGFANGVKSNRRLKVVRFTDTPDDDYLRRDTIVRANIYFI